MNKILWNEVEPDGLTTPITRQTSELGWVDALTFAAANPIGIQIDSFAFKTILAHVKGSRVEVGGLLLGETVAWPDLSSNQSTTEDKPSRPLDSTSYPFSTRIKIAVPARQTSQSPVFLEMEASVWIEARELAPHLTIVGWFHSHPDLGAFFSSTDRNTQRNFFRLPHQLGLVIDPFRNEIACFAGADSTDVSSMLGSTETICSEDVHSATT